jgi:hypothetical protein
LVKSFPDIARTKFFVTDVFIAVQSRLVLRLGEVRRIGLWLQKNELLSNVQNPLGLKTRQEA